MIDGGAAANGRLADGQTQVRVGLGGLAAVGVLALLSLVAVAAYLDPGDVGKPGRFVAGRVDDLQPGSVRYFEGEHFYLVRLADGSFLALYDIDRHRQILSVGATGDPRFGCRVRAMSAATNEGVANILRASGTVVPGFEGQAFRTPCTGATFDMTGRRLFGPAPTDLDRFPVRTLAGGFVEVNLASRQCALTCIEPRR